MGFDRMSEAQAFPLMILVAFPPGRYRRREKSSPPSMRSNHAGRWLNDDTEGIYIVATIVQILFYLFFSLLISFSPSVLFAFDSRSGGHNS